MIPGEHDEYGSLGRVPGYDDDGNALPQPTEGDDMEPCWVCEGRGSSIHTYGPNCAAARPSESDDE